MKRLKLKISCNKLCVKRNNLEYKLEHKNASGEQKNDFMFCLLALQYDQADERDNAPHPNKKEVFTMAGYFDGLAIYRESGTGGYDARGIYREPGEGGFDFSGTWRDSCEGGIDKSGTWRDSGASGLDGGGHWSAPWRAGSR